MSDKENVRRQSLDVKLISEIDYLLLDYADDMSREQLTASLEWLNHRLLHEVNKRFETDSLGAIGQAAEARGLHR